MLTFRRLLPLFALLLLASCFPVELDVNENGQLLIVRQEGYFLFDPASGKVRRVRGAVGGKPVYARFSPNGKEMLAVVEAKDGFNEFQFYITPLDGGKERKIYRAQNTVFTRYSPDGKQLAIIRVAKEKKPPLEDAAPTIDIVDVKTGEKRSMGDNLGHLCHWFSNSRQLLVFKINGKTESDDFRGDLSVLDVTTKRLTPLTSLIGSNQMYFDLSPDDSKVLVTAKAAAKGGQPLDAPQSSDTRLFEIDVATRAIRRVRDEARYAIYSPDGKKVLVGGPVDGFSFDELKLEIADAALEKFFEVAGNAHMPMSFGGEGVLFPGWAGNDGISYFVQRVVYGSGTKSVHLVMVGADGKNRRYVQPAIDAKAFEFAE